MGATVSRFAGIAPLTAEIYLPANPRFQSRYSSSEISPESRLARIATHALTAASSFWAPGAAESTWCGVREGELLALKPRRFDFERGTLTVAESYQRIDGQDVLTDPKTPKSKRVIAMPRFDAEEMEAFLSALDLGPDERIFPVTKHFLSHEMARGSKAAGLEPIRVLDLRHSHVSLLIDMGFSALAIADRMGHEAADITYRYAHLFPSVQADMARALDGARREN